MTRKYDQRNTLFKDDIRDLWDAILGKPRADGRIWILAVSHELKNVFVELGRDIKRIFR